MINMNMACCQCRSPRCQSSDGCCLGRTLLAPAPSQSGPVFIYQPALPYPFNAQEPYIDAETQMLHWTKHTATYFENLNHAIAPFPQLQVRPSPGLFADASFVCSVNLSLLDPFDFVVCSIMLSPRIFQGGPP